ncbi:hypothetical protein [Microbacterium aurum]|nr:hypothetical protein [Microbacterium aurum]MBM7827655.1 hypothetical protein [Microbacterium aurum]
MDFAAAASILVAIGALCAAAWSVFQIYQRSNAGSRYDRWRNIRESLAKNSTAYTVARDEEEKALISLVATRERMPAIAQEVFWAITIVVVGPLSILLAGQYITSPEGEEVLAWSDLTWWRPTLLFIGLLAPLMALFALMFGLYVEIYHFGRAFIAGEVEARTRLGLNGGAHLKYRSTESKKPPAP